jgi:peptidoglycan/LPS O-acetylase OafA/YrhL
MPGDSSQQISAPEKVPNSGLSPRHFEFVDALRGYAILAVILFHVNQLVLHSYPLLHGVASYGGSGVQVFFVISAFTLFWSLQNRLWVDRRPMLAFFARRWFRVAPLFWVGILFYVGHPDFWRDQFAPAGVGLPQILSTILFVHGWYPTTINSVVPGGWSIAAEMMFYLTLPFLFRWIRTFNTALVLAVATSLIAEFCRPLAVKVLLGHFPAGWSELIRLFVSFTFPAQFPCFCWGIVLYFLLTGERHYPLRRVGAIFICVAPLSLGLTDIFVAASTVPAAWILATFAVPVINNRLIRRVGIISYSAYLWHFAILDRVAVMVLPRIHLTSQHRYVVGTFRLLGLYLSVVAVTVPVAWLSYFVIEQPFIRCGKWLVNLAGWSGSRARHGGATNQSA